MTPLMRLKRYQVLLEGENFLINCDGEHRKLGFRATRIITAPDAENARKIAIIRLHHELNESALKIMASADVQRVFVTGIQELKRLQWVRRTPPARFDFYPENEAPGPVAANE